MTKPEFMAELESAEAATQSQMRNGTPEIYFEEFEHWPLQQFKTAIQAACRTSNRFPTIRMIHANRPVNHNTGALQRIKHDRDDYQPMTEHPVREIPEDLKHLTDEELKELFYAADFSPRTHAYHLGNFRKGNWIYMQFVRDQIKVAGVR